MAEIPVRVVARTGRGTLEIVQETIHPPAAGEVLIDVNRSLVSPGTELAGGWKALRQERDNPSPLDKPRPIGYSNAGVIRTVGDGVTRLEPGMRVAAVGAGYARHADVAVVPQNLVFPLPDSVDFEAGAFVMLAATALHAVRRTEVSIGEYVAVLGLGLVGQLSAQLLSTAGCYGIGWDLIASRIATARAWGIDAVCDASAEDPVAASLAFSGGNGLDAGVVAIAGEATAAVQQLERSMKVSPDGHSTGTITIVGGIRLDYNAETTNIDYRRASRTGPGYHDEAWERGADYPSVFVRWSTRTNAELCLRLMAEGKLDVAPLVTHRIGLHDCRQGIEDLLDHHESALGVVFAMR